MVFYAHTMFQVQFIKLINNNVGSTNVPTVTTSKVKIPTVNQNAAVTTIDKDTPIIVASSGISTTNLLKGATSVPTSKSGVPSNITVLPVITPSVVSCFY